MSDFNVKYLVRFANPDSSNFVRVATAGHFLPRVGDAICCSLSDRDVYAYVKKVIHYSGLDIGPVVVADLYGDTTDSIGVLDALRVYHQDIFNQNVSWVSISSDGWYKTYILTTEIVGDQDIDWEVVGYIAQSVLISSHPRAGEMDLMKSMRLSFMDIVKHNPSICARSKCNKFNAFEIFSKWYQREESQLEVIFQGCEIPFDVILPMKLTAISILEHAGVEKSRWPGALLDLGQS